MPRLQKQSDEDLQHQHREAHLPSVPVPVVKELGGEMGEKHTPTPGEWQPIETAPKDGSGILVAFSGIGVFQVFWSEQPFGPGIGAWCVTDNKHEDRPLRGYRDDGILGWMPLPAPPVAKAEGQ